MNDDEENAMTFDEHGKFVYVKDLKNKNSSGGSNEKQPATNESEKKETEERKSVEKQAPKNSDNKSESQRNASTSNNAQSVQETVSSSGQQKQENRSAAVGSQVPQGESQNPVVNSLNPTENSSCKF
jgi:hypothetical protein